MAISASFTVSQGADRTKVVITDTTPYNDTETRESFSGRTLIIYKADGTMLATTSHPTSPINFSYEDHPEDTIEITGLGKDYAIAVYMTLTPAISQSGSVYSSNGKFALIGHTMTAFYERKTRKE